MKTHASRSILTVCLALTLAITLIVPVLADPMEATINLGREPEPPYCVENPGGTLDINWFVTYETTPNFVLYELWDPTMTVLLETETYPGATGVNIMRSWVVPNGLVDGKYWIRIEFWSYEAGNEANAEVSFYVCNGTGSICAEKWDDTDCDGILNRADLPIQGWWVCLETPYGDQYCQQTDQYGIACWDGLQLGQYTVFEVMQPDWVPIYPISQLVDLEWGESITITFFNSMCPEPTPTRESTWGQIKRIYE
ncbi:MAG: hypothetical protein KJ970_05725 [Candidatus Eisenbacteria bacterium]|uniref:SD-repeat containing protein B domain-containing protein n=1 Tax=Eiseniibacteriota bacterium TaxID=2212470 RepID=A0A948RSW9_UNCEI|nr:hypothetical protein [Candidatus Eisenbacteria bacterium]MBU1949335.1 hypothetical protein [Candidatus Eisenbacteria bacterium]MBU2690408.1 hypothetical protein [Candidatus Eisenbacteria bacterium]